MTRDLRELLEAAVPAQTMIDLEQIDDRVARRRVARVGAGVAVAVAALAVGVGVGVLGPDDDPAPVIDQQESEAPADTDTPEPQPGPAFQGEPRSLDEIVEGSTQPTVDPGVYTSRALGPGLALALDEEFAVWVASQRRVLLLSTDMSAASMETFITRIDGVIAEEYRAEVPERDTDPTAYLADVPASLGAFLDTVDQVRVLDQGTGQSALGDFSWWDVNVTSTQGPVVRDCAPIHRFNSMLQNRHDYGGVCVNLFLARGNLVSFVTGKSYRFIQFDDQPDLLVFSVERDQGGPAAQFATRVAAGIGPA